jgi:hypothetical protein
LEIGVFDFTLLSYMIIIEVTTQIACTAAGPDSAVFGVDSRRKIHMVYLTG